MAKIRFLSKINFGLGFVVPIKWDLKSKTKSGEYTTSDDPSGDGPAIELESNEPLWEQLEAYSHEILHAAIDFDRVMRQRARDLKEEAEDTRKELSDE